MENYSLSDVASVVGNRSNSGFGGESGAWWIIILFLFLFGANGFGGRNVGGTPMDSPVTTTQFESENNFRTLDNQLRSITNGMCQQGYELANLINGTTAQITGDITTEGRNLQMQIADCCCTTQRAIDSVKYDNAQNTQKVIDLLQGNRIAEMQNQINQLQLQSAMCGVVRYPNAMAYNAGASPFCNGGSCGGVTF